jgi:hypothetical protein
MIAAPHNVRALRGASGSLPVLSRKGPAPAGAQLGPTDRPTLPSAAAGISFKTVSQPRRSR